MSKLSRLGIALVLSFVAATTAAAHAQPVVGGTTVPAGKWPAVVAVELDGGWCSGTLIAPDVVLTAGHCVDAGPQAVFVGTLDYGGPGGERIAVRASTAYPDWERSYDVGVLVLAHAASVAPRPIAAACTAKAALVTGNALHLVGFGLTTPSGTGNNTRLHEADIRVTDPTCELDAGCESSIAPRGEFAAGGRGTDACFGDSGGPVFAAAPDGAAVLGVVSRGMAVGGAPCGGGGIYVRADRVAAWVKRVTGRTIARSSCRVTTADEPADEPTSADATDATDDDGGCSAGGTAAGGGVILGLLVVAGLLMRKRRR